MLMNELLRILKRLEKEQNNNFSSRSILIEWAFLPSPPCYYKRVKHYTV